MSVVVPKWQRHVGSLGRLHYPTSLLTYPKPTQRLPSLCRTETEKEQKNTRSTDKQRGHSILLMNIIYSSTKPRKKDLFLKNKHISATLCLPVPTQWIYISSTFLEGCFTQCTDNNDPMFSTTYPGRAFGSAQQLFMVCSTAVPNWLDVKMWILLVGQAQEIFQVKSNDNDLQETSLTVKSGVVIPRYSHCPVSVLNSSI